MYLLRSRTDESRLFGSVSKTPRGASPKCQRRSGQELRRAVFELIRRGGATTPLHLWHEHGAYGVVTQSLLLLAFTLDWERSNAQPSTPRRQNRRRRIFRSFVTMSDLFSTAIMDGALNNSRPAVTRFDCRAFLGDPVVSRCRRQFRSHSASESAAFDPRFSKNVGDTNGKCNH